MDRIFPEYGPQCFLAVSTFIFIFLDGMLVRYSLGPGRWSDVLTTHVSWREMDLLASRLGDRFKLIAVFGEGGIRFNS